MRYVIIGAGAAGIAAAEAIRSRDNVNEVLIICDDPHGYYSRPGLAYLLTDELPEKALFPFQKRDFDHLKIKWLIAKATRIEPDSHSLYFRSANQNSESSLKYDRLLIANGASAVPSDTPGANLEGVFKLDSMADAHNIQTLTRKSKTGVIIGGGITALELVEALVARRIKTHYLLRGDRYWNNVLDETESRIVEHRLKEHGVIIHFKAEVAEIVGKKNRVESVLLKDGSSIRCEMVGVAIGVKPRMELAKSANLNSDRGILVSERMETSAPDIYAAGDCAQVFDPISRKSVVDSLWQPAREQGRVAGLNMAGESCIYVKAVAFNVTRLAELTTTIIGTVGGGKDADMVGIARGDSETWRQLPDAIAAQSNFEINHIRLMVGDRYLLGAIVMGDQTLSFPLEQIVSNRVDITPIKEKLLTPGVKFGDVIIDFYNRVRLQSN